MFTFTPTGWTWTFFYYQIFRDMRSFLVQILDLVSIFFSSGKKFLHVLTPDLCEEPIKRHTNILRADIFNL